MIRSKPQLSIIKGQQQDITPCSLHKLFENNLHQHSCKPALIYNGKTLTYKEVNERSNQYAGVILREYLDHSLKPNHDGDFVIAVCMEPSDYLVMVLLAVWKAGAAYIAIDPILTESRINHIIEETRPAMVIYYNDTDRTLFRSSYTLNINELHQKAIQMHVTNIPDSQMLNTTKDLAIILYTSASTGVPKGVKLPHAALMNRLKWQWLAFPFTADESVGVFKTSLTFVDSVMEIWSTLLYGLAVLVVPMAVTKNPEKLVTLLDEYKIGRIVLVPSLLRNILMYLQMVSKTHNTVQMLPNLRNWVCSGEPLQKQLVKQFFDCFGEGSHILHNFYGCTEVMGDVIYFTCESKEQLKLFENIPIGLPISNTVIYILDKDFRPVVNGEIGEIFVSGLNLANGYVNGRDPDRFIENPFTAEEKFSRLYKTGDFGSFREGYINFNGRTDSQIKIRGHRVDLTEVETTILSMNVIEKAIVLCYHVFQTDVKLLAFVQLNDASPCLTGLEIEAALKNELQDYMIPEVVIIDKVPLLVNGKVDRQALLRSFESKENQAIDFDLTQVPDDKKLIASDIFQIVGSVIGPSTRGTLTVNSNFYEMGGNSLNSIMTITLLREKGYHIEISDFISAKNLGEILHIVTQKLTGPKEAGRSRLPHLYMKAIQLCEADKEDFIEILTDSFYVKGDLEYWVLEKVTRKDLFCAFENLWNNALNKGYSFTVKDMNTNQIIGVVANFDARDEPELIVTSSVASTFDIGEVLEAPFRANTMPLELNKVMHAAYVATNIRLTPQENLACIHFMEEEILKLAKRKNFMAVLTTNSNPLTQQLANDVFKYRCLVDYQVNKYIHKDGTIPFALAPDSQKIMVHYKEL